MNDQSHDDKLKAFSQKLEQFENPSTSSDSSETIAKQNTLGIGFRVGVELAAGIAIGCGLGLLIDHYFDTSPWGLIVLFFLGSAAGFLNVYRAIGKMGYSVGYKEEKPNQPSSD
jgi:ATP synthase protein I